MKHERAMMKTLTGRSRLRGLPIQGVGGAGPRPQPVLADRLGHPTDGAQHALAPFRVKRMDRAVRHRYGAPAVDAIPRYGGSS